jgi:hypothetical protein
MYVSDVAEFVTTALKRQQHQPADTSNKVILHASRVNKESRDWVIGAWPGLLA